MVLADELQHRLAEAERIVREAGRLARHHFAHLGALSVEKKGLQDYVSAADREVEAQIREALTQTFPGEGFIGEESGGQAAAAVWVSDPIDGTNNFLRGIPLYGISLAFVRDRRTQVGVIYLPELDELYTATRDGPALVNGRELAVRTPATLADSVVIVGYSPNRPRDEFLAHLKTLFDAECEFRRFGSATVSLCLVAAGRTDGFWQQRLSPWDVLAGLLIVERAGGRVNDFLADGGLENGNPVLAAAPTIADRLSAIVDIPLAPARGV